MVVREEKRGLHILYVSRYGDQVRGHVTLVRPATYRGGDPGKRLDSATEVAATFGWREPAEADPAARAVQYDRVMAEARAFFELHEAAWGPFLV